MNACAPRAMKRQTRRTPWRRREAVLAGIVCAALLGWTATATAAAPPLKWTDPAGDDFGPGSYVYPTDAAHTPSSYDLREVSMKARGTNVEITITFGAKLSDPWYSKGWAEPGHGFSLQMVQLYIDSAPKTGSTATLPGVNARFAAADAWEKVVLISPQGNRRLKREVSKRAGDLAKAVVLPRKVTVRGKTLVVTVRRSQLGGAPTDAWGIQAVVMGSDGFPAKGHLLTRRVNKLPGQHRFGGGRDDGCDPNVLDILAGNATGAASEIDAQKAALAYTCGPSGEPTPMPTLPMVRLKSPPDSKTATDKPD